MYNFYDLLYEGCLGNIMNIKCFSKTTFFIYTHIFSTILHIFEIFISKNLSQIENIPVKINHWSVFSSLSDYSVKKIG